MKQSRKEYFRKNRYKRINHFLIGGTLTASLFGVSYMSGNTYALYTDSYNINSGSFQAAWVFPRTMESFKGNLPNIYQNKNSSPNMSENALQEFEQKIKDVQAKITPYYNRAQLELNNLNDTLQIFKAHFSNPSQIESISSKEYMTAVNTIDKYFDNLYGPINKFSISDNQKYIDLLSAIKKGQINPYTFVLYIEQNIPEDQNKIEFLSSYIQSLQLQVDGAEKVFGYVSESYQEIMNECKLLQDKVDQIRNDIEKERLEKEINKKKKDQKEREDKENKAKEEQEQKDENDENKTNQNTDQQENIETVESSESIVDNVNESSTKQTKQVKKIENDNENQTNINSNEEEISSNESDNENSK